MCCGDVLSPWSGLRPLIHNLEDDANGGGGAKGLVRSHLVFASPRGLMTIVGGKWITHRKMTEECVGETIKGLGLEGRLKTVGQGKIGLDCVTEKLKLVDDEGWSRNAFIGLIQRASYPHSFIIVMEPDEKSTCIIRNRNK